MITKSIVRRIYFALLRTQLKSKARSASVIRTITPTIPEITADSVVPPLTRALAKTLRKKMDRPPIRPTRSLSRNHESSSFIAVVFCRIVTADPTRGQICDYGLRDGEIRCLAEAG